VEVYAVKRKGERAKAIEERGKKDPKSEIP
jgi:hypothetical protein